jgi:ABC-2 type transport system permease protein
MMRYLRLWYYLSVSSIQVFFVSRVGTVLFFIGKLVRFFFFFGFLILLVSRTKILAGYNFWQIILFYLTFNFIDSATQTLFRAVYQFRQQIVSGNFDLILVKPVNSLFRSLFGWTDLLDLITLLPFMLFIGFILTRISNITVMGIILYIALLINSLIIAMSFHIMVLALAVLTTEIDHAIMIYRDISGMGKLPVDIYRDPLKTAITFFIPVGIMMTFPVKALMGLLSIPAILSAFSINLVILFLSIGMWNYALRKYTSASS